MQRAVHRIQSEEVTRAAIEEARASGFRSVNLDLIYGLPKQTLDGFAARWTRCSASRDRIALYSAHLPAMFKPQRRIAEAGPAGGGGKLQILTLAIGRLTRAGYVYIGMDHFAKPGRRARAGAGAGGCSATSRATRRTPTATCSRSASRRSARWGRPITRT